MAHEEIKQCYLIEDDNEALKCVQDKIAESKDSCKPKMVLLVQDGCDSCAQQKKRYLDDIIAGKISVVNVKTKEGLEIVKANGLDATPYLVVLDCNNKLIE